MNQEVNTDAFECEGASVTVFFSSEGKHLQECIIDVLNVHMEKQAQTLRHPGICYNWACRYRFANLALRQKGV